MQNKQFGDSKSSRGGKNQKRGGGFQRGRGDRGGRGGSSLGKNAEPNEYDDKTEDEIKHLEYLKANYRDRAKERRMNERNDNILQSQMEIEQEGQDDNQIAKAIPETEKPMFEMEARQYQDMKKGLDFEILKQELENVKKEQEKSKILQKFEPQEQKVLKNKSLLALQIDKVLSVPKNKIDTILINSNSYYEYDLHHDFGKGLPNLLTKRQQQGIEEQERFIIPSSINNNVLKNLENIQEYLRQSGGDVRKIRALKWEAQEKERINKQLVLKQQQEDDDIFADAKDYVESDNKDSQKKVKIEGNLFKDIKHKTPEFLNKQIDSKEQEEQSKQQINMVLKKELQKKQREENKGSAAFNIQQEEYDGYGECYPRIEMSLEQMKEGRDEVGGKTFAETYFKENTFVKSQPKQKSMNKEMEKIEKIMKEKRAK